jgi:hypothetical protein
MKIGFLYSGTGEKSIKTSEKWLQTGLGTRRIGYRTNSGVNSA